MPMMLTLLCTVIIGVAITLPTADAESEPIYDYDYEDYLTKERERFCNSLDVEKCLDPGNSEKCPELCTKEEIQQLEEKCPVKQSSECDMDENYCVYWIRHCDESYSCNCCKREWNKVCQKLPKPGNCYGDGDLQYYFSPRSGNCRTFRFYCGEPLGNENVFSSIYECEYRCMNKKMDWDEICQSFRPPIFAYWSQRRPTAKEGELVYTFNSLSGKCETHGDVCENSFENCFKTLDKCNEKCNKADAGY